MELAKGGIPGPETMRRIAEQDGCIIPNPPTRTVTVCGDLAEKLKEWAENPPPEVIRVFREILAKFDEPNRGPRPFVRG